MVKKGHFHVSDIMGVIESVSSVSKNPPKDMLIQAIDNGIDATEYIDGEKIISIYRTKLTGLQSLVIEDSGHGMNQENLKIYEDVGKSLKKWTRALGWYGIGRFAYLIQGKSGVFIETRSEDGYEDWCYILIDGISGKEEITCRSNEPNYDVWKYYSDWLKQNNRPPIKRGTRILVWNVDDFIMNEIVSKSSSWIARQYPDKLDDIEIYFEYERVFAKPPSPRYQRTVRGEADGCKWEGKLFYCNKPLDEPGIGVRAVNRTVEYTFFNVAGYEQIKKKLWGYVDLNNVITSNMVSAAKDGIKEGTLKNAIWRDMRVAISKFAAYCEDNEIAEKRSGAQKALSGLSRLCEGVMEMMERPPDEFITDDDHTPHKKLEKEETTPLVERNNKFICKRCDKPMSKKPSKEGVITNLDALKRMKCPCCGYLFKKKAHKSALGKRYRIYICKKCGHHHFKLDQQTHGFQIEIIKKWDYEENREFHWGDEFYINENHINFKTANTSSKKSANVEWPKIKKPLDILYTPLEHYIVNCVALAFTIREVGDHAKIEDFLEIYNTFRINYSRKIWKLKGDVK